MIGTFLNAGGVLLGGLLGLVIGSRLSESLQDALMKVTGVSMIVLGLSGSLEGLSQLSQAASPLPSPMLMIICIALGTLIGELVGIETGFENLGHWLKTISKSEGDSGFVDAFLTTSLTICIGAMAIIGSIEDGLTGDYSILAAKSVLDGLVIFILSASKGKGVVFSAVPLFLFQGSINRLAFFLAPLITEQALANLSLVGNVLIFCVGLNLVFGKMVKVGNMLPALVLAVLASVFM